MILAPLADADRYAPLHPLFGNAFAWMAGAGNLSKDDGRYPIDGERLIVIVETGTTKPAAERRFESHRRYIDIQVNLIGPELMEWLPAHTLTIEDDFQPDGDIAFYAAPTNPATRLIVPPRHFAIFWPEDAHKPSCSPGAEPIPFRKLVFKVEAAAR